MIKILKNLNTKEKILIVVIVLLTIFQVYLDLLAPEYMSKITRLVQTQGSVIGEILKNGGIMMLCAFGSLLGAVVVGYLSSSISSSFSYRLRKKIFKKTEEFSMAEMKEFTPSSLITRTTNDVSQVQMLLSIGMQILIKSPILAVWAILKIVDKGSSWTILTAGSVVFVVTYIAIMVLFVYPKFKKVQESIDKLNGIARENLIGIRVVRAFNAEDYQEDKFSDINNNLTKIQTFLQKMMSTLHPVLNLTMYIMTIGIYYIGAQLIDAALITDKLFIFSDMVVFSTYGMMILMSFVSIAMIFVMIPRASVSAGRINEVIDRDADIKDGVINRDVNGISGKVEFQNVFFKYPDADEYMLEDISFSINQGDTFAIIGSTGSGKSTLINLLPRFYDATEGKVLVNDIDVKEYKGEYLNQKIGYVPQKAGMFSGTVKTNVDYGNSGKKKNEDKLLRAVEIAQAKDFVEKLDEKYDAHIARGGTNVSGGQKQRLSIARAIMREPEIYIFDDTFSALDYKTDLKLRQELKKHTKKTTTIIVSQRIGTIMHADQILVLDKGKVAGLGTHKQLLKDNKVYREIALSQLNEKEMVI